ncbi:hypothetical protein [Pseudonocardia sp. TRM90224]|uniref:hypothetical protein n=1 Tax=Pseudonocardia sp. TRM90224 TaxID=2812678 RepID=UPI001E2F91BA|nr:hypothetical protein [Pseudonocardia sp. TRM90224]
MRPEPRAADYANLDAVRFLFSPIAHLVTGVVLGVEIQPRIRDHAAADMVASIAAADGG